MTGTVEFHLRAVDDGTEVCMREVARGMFRVGMPLLRMLLHARNRASLEAPP